MEYVCLQNLKRGYVATRKPVMVDDKELSFTFTGAPVDSTAIFENADGIAVYRSLATGTCTVPVKFLLDGEVKVAVAQLNGSEDAVRVSCEPLFVECKNGVVLVYPNWLDLHEHIIEVFKAVNDIKAEQASLLRKHNALNKKVEKLLDGYDFD